MVSYSRRNARKRMTRTDYSDGEIHRMLRRVLAERDGGIIAVTLMSSDMGKLYAALAQIDRRR